MNNQRISGFYIFIVALFIGMLFINLKFFKGSSGTNIGITDAKVYNINSEKPGLIKKILVIPGQEIKTGDLLVQMENNLLEMDIVKLQTRLSAMKKEKVEKGALIQSKIDYLQAEEGITQEELQSEIQQINSELNLNRRLTEQFSGTNPNQEEQKDSDPQLLKIKSLQEKSSLHRQAIDIKTKELLKDNAAELLVLDNEIDLKEQELELMLIEKRKLNKYATFNGVVESVFVKPGEQIEAYSSIISINPIHPSSIVGYMVGAKGRETPIGEKVMVTSYEHKNIIANGEIIGFGAVVELPELLQKATATKSFGRQVFIKIPEDNKFTIGEKVLIK